jgi:hypothetical protein
MATTSGSSYNFSGSSTNQIQMGSGNKGLLNGATSATLACWANFSNLTNNQGLFSDDLGASYSDSTYIFYIESAKFNINFVHDPSNFIQVQTTSTLGALITTGSWHHLCWTWSGGSLVGAFNFYLDGVSQSITIFGPGTAGTVNTLQVGSATQGIGAFSSTGNFYNFSGSIAHINLWKNTVLSVGQVLTMMRNPVAIPSGMVSYVPMMDAAVTDRVTGTVASSISAQATQSLSGPPVSFSSAMAQ